ncbi:MAG: efflux RND transporter periplasmic adaptor subunit, partial [Schwartzia sp.]|nr:efflux RND transporter periplasmic adaptor subunit [Schwartzia sp. (in: firmicutes)]
MDAQRYLKMAIVGVICIVVFVVGYGVYINDASRRHIDKMAAAQYTVLPVAHADYRDIHATIQGVDVTARASWTVDVTAQYEGVLEDVHVVKSQWVTEGDLLATMKNNDLLAQIASAEADIEAARAQFINAEQTVNRYQYLVEHNAISVQEYDSAVSQRDAARAQMESRMAQRDLVRSEQGKMIISAPRSANIVQVYREAGKYVRAGEALFMMADLRELTARSVLSHDQLKQIMSVGDRFILEVQPHRLVHKAYPISNIMPRTTTVKLNQFLLSVARTIPDVNSETDFHEITWRVENPTGILEPTYYDDVKIMSQNTVRVLAVPSRAIHRDAQGVSFVFTLDGDSRLARRTVTCGIEGDGLTEIASGLSQGESVVVAEP